MNASETQPLPTSGLDVPHAHWDAGWEVLAGIFALAALCEGLSRCLPVPPSASSGSRHPSQLAHWRRALPGALHVGASVLGWWFAALALTVSNRRLLTTALDGQWRFPFTTAFVHVSIKFAVAAGVLACRRRVHGDGDLSHAARSAPVWQLLQAGGAVGAATGCDIALSTAALAHLHVAVYTLMKNTSLVWTLALSLALGLVQPSFRQACLVSSIMLGMYLTSSAPSGAKWSVLGVLLALGGTMAGSVRWVFSERMFKTGLPLLLGVVAPGEEGQGSQPTRPHRPDAWLYVYLISPGAMLLLGPLAVLWEGRALLAMLQGQAPDQLLMVALALAGTGCLATGLVLTQAVVVGATSALSVAVLAFLKDILQVVLAAVALGEAVSPQAALGIAIVMSSSAGYAVLKALQAGAPGSPIEKTPAEGAENQKDVGDVEEGAGLLAPGMRGQGAPQLVAASA